LRVVGIASDWEMQLMSGGVVGFLAYSLLGAVANFFKQNEKADIVTLVNKAKGKRK